MKKLTSTNLSINSEHFSGVNVFQYSLTATTTWPIVFGNRLATTWIRSVQTSSMGFKSWLRGGDFTQLIPVDSRNSWDNLAECFGLLSWWNRWPSGKFSAMNGTTFSSKISRYMAVVRAPSNIWSGEAPLRLMAPHRWSVVCCFGTLGSTGVPLSWFRDARKGLRAVLPMKMSWSKWSSRCEVHQEILELLWLSVSTGFRRIRL